MNFDNFEAGLRESGLYNTRAYEMAFYPDHLCYTLPPYQAKCNRVFKKKEGRKCHSFSSSSVNDPITVHRTHPRSQSHRATVQTERGFIVKLNVNPCDTHTLVQLFACLVLRFCDQEGVVDSTKSCTQFSYGK